MIVQGAMRSSPRRLSMVTRRGIEPRRGRTTRDRSGIPTQGKAVRLRALEGQAEVEKAWRGLRLSTFAPYSNEVQELARLVSGDVVVGRQGDHERRGDVRKPAPTKLSTHLTLERILPIGLQVTGRDERSPAHPGRTCRELRDDLASNLEERLSTPDANEHDANVVDVLRPSLAKMAKGTLRNRLKAHGCVDQHVVDAPAISIIE